MKKYLPARIETKWQKRWDKDKSLTRARDDSKKRKYYCLCMFPYPSGEGLHVGHVESYTATDIISRYKRMNGLNVIYPMGWDAFGLPAENYAIKQKTHPAKTTAQNIRTYTKQLKSLGLSYDWDREINSSDPNYYKWTQWLFIYLYKKGLAYKAKGKVNWCNKCQTVLANEQVIDGKCERCDSNVVQKDLEQWYFKITHYTKKLLKGLDKIDWPKSVKESQRNWIGKSDGAEIFFDLKKISKEEEKQLAKAKNSSLETAAVLKKCSTIGRIKVFTTRPDTIFGATFLVLAPDGKILPELEGHVTNLKAVKSYQKKAKKKNDLERTDLNKNKTGILVKGITAVNPATSKPTPVYTADYVLADYGGGAVMSVPAHDRRDFEFAYKYNLPIKRVNYQEDKYLGFIDFSFFKNQKAFIGKLRTYEFGLTFLEKKGKKIISTPKYSEKNSYAAVCRISDKNKLNKYTEIIQSYLKNGFFSEIIGGKYFSFIFKDEILKDKSEDDILEITKRIKKSISHISNKNPRRIELKKIFKNENIQTDTILWTIPSEEIKKQICFDEKIGHIQNSAFLDGMKIDKGWERIIKWLTEKKIGKNSSTFRLRDWLVSRQRYWGAPIPIIYCPKCGTVPVPEKDLPVVLPKNAEFKPTGESPLKTNKSFVNTKCPKCNESAEREVDTMDTFVCSSWYYLRYADPNNDKEFASLAKIRKYLPVDLYIGGIEHAVLHLLYSRFITKALKDEGYVDFNEPFLKLRNQGIILGPNHQKMSKSKGNVINPDDVVKEFGADTLRLYEMFMGPLEDMKPWNPKNILGVRRFLEKVWSLAENIKDEDEDIKPELHKTIKKVTEDIENISFNTAISQMMILVNNWKKQESVGKKEFEIFLTLLSPFAPHIAEEIWEMLGNKKSIFYKEWPKYDEKYLQKKSFLLVIQIDGKKRGEIELDTNISEEKIKEKVLAQENVIKFIKGKKINRFIYIPQKVVNIATSNS